MLQGFIVSLLPARVNWTARRRGEDWENRWTHAQRPCQMIDHAPRKRSKGRRGICECDSSFVCLFFRTDPSLFLGTLRAVFRQTSDQRSSSSQDTASNGLAFLWSGDDTNDGEYNEGIASIFSGAEPTCLLSPRSRFGLWFRAGGRLKSRAENWGPLST